MRKGMAAVDPSLASHGAAGSLAPAAAVARSPVTCLRWKKAGWVRAGSGGFYCVGASRLYRAGA